MHRRRRWSEQADRVGAELPVLFGPAVRLGRALIQTQHELQVLVRFLLVRQRPVVRAFVLCAPMTPTAALQRGVSGGQFPVGDNSGAGGTQQGDKRGQEEDT